MVSVTIDELTLADDPERWAGLGFAVQDARCVLGAVSIHLAGEQRPGGITGWSLREIASTDLDGLPTRLSHATTSPDGEGVPAHPNGVLAIDHVVAITPDFERTVSTLQSAGLDLRRVREEPTPAGAPRQAFFRLGSEILELVAEPEEVAARAGSPGGPAIFWGLAFLTADLERTAAAFAPHVGEPRAAVQHGRRIATVRRSAGLCVPIALMTPREQEGQT
jgi:hypothetical protein